MTTTASIWDPIRIGRMTLTHRLALAPMTRNRALPGGVPGSLAVEYYRQRAALGMLVTEGTQPSADGQGYMSTPGMHTDAQEDGWRRVADVVHDAGSHLVVQLMHAGRIAHPDNTEHHRRPMAPSAIAPGMHMHTPTGKQPIPTPQEMDDGEIATTIDDFRTAARRAVDAGADAVEIHGANGYLLHQFLAPNANTRTDGWGGSVENRVRLTLEVATAVAAEIGPDRTGIRLSPGSTAGGLDEGADGPDLYRHLVTELDRLDLAFLDVFHFGDEALLRDIRSRWNHPLLLIRAGRTIDDVGRDVADGLADMAPVGSAALAYPDIIARLRAGGPFNTPDVATFYVGGEHGYTDYPTLATLEG